MLAKMVAAARRSATVAVALPLLYLVMTIGSAVAGAVAMLCVIALGRIYSPNLAWDFAVAAVAGALAGLYGAVPLTRFVLRVFPLHADGTRRWTLMFAMVLGTTGLIAVVLWELLHPSPVTGGAPGAQSVLVGMIVAVMQLQVLLRVYGTHDAGIVGPQVLYLRRFRSFSDRVVYRTLLRAMPSGASVTALVSTQAGPRDLDPFTIAFDGLRFLNPLASMPRTFASADADWRGHVRTLMLAAQCIVIDGSADSVSMRYEYGLIDTLGLGARTIVLADAELTGASPPAFSGAAVVRYRRSRWPSAPRVLVWVGLVVLYGALSMLYPFVYQWQGLPFFLLVLPALAQRSVRRDALVQLRAAVRLRVLDTPRQWMRKLLGRTIALGVGLAAALVGLAVVAVWWFRPLPSTDLEAWEVMSQPMSTAVMKVGEQEIQVPVPAGFLDPKNLHRGLLDSLSSYEGSGVRMLAVLLPYGQVARMVFDPTRPFDERLVVFTPLEAESQSMDLETFTGAIDFIRQRVGDALPPGSSLPTPVAAGNRFLSLSFTRPFRVVVDGETVVVVKACVVAWALARGKLIGLNLCRDERSERDAVWVRSLSGRWIDELLHLNPAIPPLASGGLGLSVSAGYGISRSTGALPVGKITVTEVIAGSPAAAAGLRVRDEIIAAGSIRVESDVIGVARAISSLPVGGRLTLTLHRDGIDVTVELHRP